MTVGNHISNIKAAGDWVTGGLGIDSFSANILVPINSVYIYFRIFGFTCFAFIVLLAMM